MPGNVLIIADANATEALTRGTIPVGGGTTPVRVKSDGEDWRIYGIVRRTIRDRGGSSVNLLQSPSDFSVAVWNKQNLTVFDAGLSTQAVKETVVNSVHTVGQ